MTTWDRFVRWLSKRDWGGAVDRHGHPTTTERGYIRSYIWLRLVVGGVGLLLPLILWIGEWFFLAAPVQARDSISSYYHSPMRDWFVASLAVIGVLLIAYMLGTWNKESAWSTIAGVALLGVAFLPTERPHLPKGAPLCEATPKPVDCTDLEHRFHEHTVGDIHMICAVVALFSLGVIALLFAGRAKWGDRRDPDNRLALTQLICGCVIFLSLAVAATNWIARWRSPVFELTPIYLGEVGTVLAFAVCWIVQGANLRSWLRGEERAEKRAHAA